LGLLPVRATTVGAGVFASTAGYQNPAMDNAMESVMGRIDGMRLSLKWRLDKFRGTADG
jgi:hypothetical protein